MATEIPPPTDSIVASAQPAMREPPTPAGRLDALLAILNSKNPAIGLVGLLIVSPGLGAGAASFLIDPRIDEAIEEHDNDPYAHRAAHEEQERILRRLEDAIIRMEERARARKEAAP